MNGTIWYDCGNERLHLFVIYDSACDTFSATLSEFYKLKEENKKLEINSVISQKNLK